jgi:hypothetical protein
MTVVSTEKGKFAVLRTKSRSSTPPPDRVMKFIEFQLIEPVKLLKAMLKGNSGSATGSTGNVPVKEDVWDRVSMKLQVKLEAKSALLTLNLRLLWLGVRLPPIKSNPPKPFVPPAPPQVTEKLAVASGGVLKVRRRLLVETANADEISPSVFATSVMVRKPPIAPDAAVVLVFAPDKTDKD